MEVEEEDGSVHVAVSIPSRRVGDNKEAILHALQNSVSIPSRRVGDPKHSEGLSEPSTVSIPSRRVGDPPLPPYRVAKMKCFHPLKAGRRPIASALRALSAVAFPSPQGGSETRSTLPMSCAFALFPSPQGGSETSNAARDYDCPRRVSIPSRRVGDMATLMATVVVMARFHPLKAGRRPRRNEGKGGQKGAKRQKGCRRPSVGGKS